MSGLFPRLQQHDAAPMLRVGDSTVSCRKLAEVCAAHQFRLKTHGVRPGDRVVVWTQPTIDTLATLIANAVSGCVTVPLDPKLGDFELGHMLRDAAPKLAFAAVPQAVAARAPSLTTLRTSLDGLSTMLEERQVDDAPLLLLYTSGTTGLAKGVELSARNVISNLDALAQTWSWSAQDTVVHALPMFHVHGLVLGLYGAIRNGAGLHWFPKFDAPALASAVADRRSMLFAVPTMYHRLLDAAETDPQVVAGLTRARLLVSGSAPLPVREHQRMRQLTGRSIVERYGLTETLINLSTQLSDANAEGTVGQPLPGVEVRLVDDARKLIEASDDATMGELAVRGPNVFRGYLNRPDATASVLDADGWFYTGDLACRRADGSFRIVGRTSTDIMKCGGYKVGAGEVEAALLEHHDVAEAAVFSVPHDDLGEQIVAVVVRRQPVNEQALADHVASLLSPHKRPRVIRFVDALPRNAMGKVQKKVLRDGELKGSTAS